MIKKPITIQLSTGLEARPVRSWYRLQASSTVRSMLRLEEKR